MNHYLSFVFDWMHAGAHLSFIGAVAMFAAMGAALFRCEPARLARLFGLLAIVAAPLYLLIWCVGTGIYWDQTYGLGGWGIVVGVALCLGVVAVVAPLLDIIEKHIKSHRASAAATAA